MKYRPEIDGLRAVAVASVILFHARLGVPGGYVGVDVFFVISGYLITRLIIDGLENERFSLAVFWERRVRRLLPALIVVLAFSISVGTYIMFANELTGLAKATLAQIALGANVFYYMQAGYFAPEAELQPLLHTWSLAVEEQFYLIYPAVLIFVWRSNRKLARILIAVIAIVSFVISVASIQSFASANFYLLPFRGWELLLGCAIGANTFVVPRSVWVRESLSWIATVMFLVAAFGFDDQTLFPGMAALLPCGAAALFIGANAEGRTRVGKLMATKPLVYVGLISYSLYLWHWPLLVFLDYFVLGVPTSMMRIAAILLSICLAAGSYRFIEMPIRRGEYARMPRQLFAGVATAVSVLAIVSGLIIHHGGLQWRFGAEIESQIARAAIYDVQENNSDPSRVQIGAMTRISDDDINEQRLPVLGLAEKLLDAPPHFLIWGDSHANVLLPVLDDLADEYGVAGYAVTNPAWFPDRFGRRTNATGISVYQTGTSTERSDCGAGAKVPQYF